MNKPSGYNSSKAPGDRSGNRGSTVQSTISGNRHPDYQRLATINSSYQDSKRLACKAVEADETSEGHGGEYVIQCYVNCLECIEHGVELDIDSAAYSGSEWDTAREQQQKLIALRTQIYDRLARLTDDNNQNEAGTPYSQSSAQSSSRVIDDVTELITIPGGVQLFFVSKDSQVATTPPSYPSFLKVLIQNSTACLFIQVNNWNYPLYIGKTPVLKTTAGAYLFPNSTTENLADGAVGIVISAEVDEKLVDAFERLLRNVTVFQQQQSDGEIDIGEESHTVVPLRHYVKVPISDQISVNIEKGAEKISSGLNSAANYATAAVKSGSDRLKERLVPNDNPVQVSPAVQTTFHYAYEASKATANVSKFLVSGLCAITSKVGDKLAVQIKEYGDRVLPAKDPESSEESVTDGAVKVLGAGLAGFGTVWTELERSGLAIANAVSKATVENVEFKYGSHAGLATDNAMGSVINVGKTAFNVNNLGIKAVAKRTAKDTGKAVLKKYSAEGQDTG